MSSNNEQLEFHKDRVQETTVRVLQSIITNPRVTAEEKLELLTELSGIHVEVVQLIHSAIEAGCQQAVDELNTASS